MDQYVELKHVTGKNIAYDFYCLFSARSIMTSRLIWYLFFSSLWSKGEKNCLDIPNETIKNNSYTFFQFNIIVKKRDTTFHLLLFVCFCFFKDCRLVKFILYFNLSTPEKSPLRFVARLLHISLKKKSQIKTILFSAYIWK